MSVPNPLDKASQIPYPKKIQPNQINASNQMVASLLIQFPSTLSTLFSLLNPQISHQGDEAISYPCLMFTDLTNLCFSGDCSYPSWPVASPWPRSSWFFLANLSETTKWDSPSGPPPAGLRPPATKLIATPNLSRNLTWLPQPPKQTLTYQPTLANLTLINYRLPC